jgi:hypothetical protein
MKTSLAPLLLFVVTGCSSGANPHDDAGSAIDGAVDLDDAGVADDLGSAGDGSDSALPCSDGQTTACYTGPEGTLGLGICAAGLATCAGGVFGACIGDVLPQIEDCTTAADEDCNGKAFDDGAAGCVCDPSVAAAACDTGMMGICQPGTRPCSIDGKSFGQCVQNLDAVFDDCSTALDENCDGVLPTCTGGPSSGFGVGAATDEVAYAVGLDESNLTAVVAGVWAGTTAADSVSAGSAFVRKVTLAGTEVFLKQYSAGAAPSYAVIRAVAVQGPTTYIAGEYKGTLDLGGSPTCNFGASNGGSVDIFVAKLDGTGACTRGAHMGDSSYQSIAAMTIYGADLILAGTYAGSLSFGPGACNLGAASGTSDVFVTKLDGTVFNCQWAKRYGDSTSSAGLINQIGHGVGVLSGGDVVMTGWFDGAIDFGGGTLTASGIDTFLVRLASANGAQVWAKRYGGTADQYGFAVAVDPTDHIALTGGFYGTIDLGNGTLTDIDGTNATADVFVARFDSSGNAVWSKRYGDTAHQTGVAVASDGAGNVVVTGSFKGTVNFGGADLVDSNNASNDLFVAKLKGAGGEHLWSARYGDAADQRAWGVTVSQDPFAKSSGHAFVAGGYQGSMSFGGAAGTLTSTGQYDAYAVELLP